MKGTTANRRAVAIVICCYPDTIGAMTGRDMFLHLIEWIGVIALDIHPNVDRERAWGVLADAPGIRAGAFVAKYGYERGFMRPVRGRRVGGNGLESQDDVKISISGGIGVCLIVLGVAAWSASTWWSDTRSWVPVAMPVSMAVGHIRTPAFKVNLNTGYRVGQTGQTGQTGRANGSA